MFSDEEIIIDWLSHHPLGFGTGVYLLPLGWTLAMTCKALRHRRPSLRSEQKNFSSLISTENPFVESMHKIIINYADRGAYRFGIQIDLQVSATPRNSHSSEKRFPNEVVVRGGIEGETNVFN
jgi:hypothetical protein